MINEFEKGDILVTEMTTPDWEPIMKIASGIITNKGGRTCHAAIIARLRNRLTGVKGIGMYPFYLHFFAKVDPNRQGLARKNHAYSLNY